MANYQRFRYCPFFIIFLFILCSIVHFFHTQPCHCLDGHRLALNWAHSKENASKIENEVEAFEQSMLLEDFGIPKIKNANEIQQILLMAETKCLPLKSPLVATICSGWPELLRLHTHGIIHGDTEHLMGNMFWFLTYGLYFEYRHGALLTSLLIFGAIFASLPTAFNASIIYGASDGCFALDGAISVDMVVILIKTGYRLAWELKAQQNSFCFTLLSFLAQLLFLVYTLSSPLSELTELISGDQIGSEDAHMAGFVTGLLFGIQINCSNESKKCGQKPIVQKWFKIVCKMIMGILVAFILGYNLLFLYRAFEIEETVLLDAKVSDMIKNDTALLDDPDLKFDYRVLLCRAYNNEKYWLVDQGVKRPAFCQPLAFVFASLQLVLAVFAFLFWKKFRLVTKQNVADISANSEADAVAMDKNGDTKEEKESVV